MVPLFGSRPAVGTGVQRERTCLSHGCGRRCPSDSTGDLGLLLQWLMGLAPSSGKRKPRHIVVVKVARPISDRVGNRLPGSQTCALPCHSLCFAEGEGRQGRDRKGVAAAELAADRAGQGGFCGPLAGCVRAPLVRCVVLQSVCARVCSLVCSGEQVQNLDL